MGDENKAEVVVVGRDESGAKVLREAAANAELTGKKLEELQATTRALAEVTKQQAQQIQKAWKDNARALEESSRAASQTRIAEQERGEKLVAALIARGDPAKEMKLQLDRELEMLREAERNVIITVQQSQQAQLAIVNRYGQQRAAAQARASGAAAAAGGPAPTGGMADLRKQGEKFEGVRALLTQLGVSASSAEGHLGALGQSFVMAGGKAGMIGIGVASAVAALVAVREEMKRVEDTERAVSAAGKEFGITEQEVLRVKNAFRGFDEQMDRKTVVGLLAAGREAGLSANEVMGLGTKIKRAADIAGTDFKEQALGTIRAFKDEAIVAKEKVDDIIRSMEQKLSGVTANDMALDAAVRTAEQRVAGARTELTGIRGELEAINKTGGRGMTQQEAARRLIALRAQETAANEKLEGSENLVTDAVEARTKARELEADELRNKREDAAIEKQARKEAAAAEKRKEEAKEAKKVLKEMTADQWKSTDSKIAAEDELHEKRMMAIAQGASSADEANKLVEVETRRHVGALAALYQDYQEERAKQQRKLLDDSAKWEKAVLATEKGITRKAKEQTSARDRERKGEIKKVEGQDKERARLGVDMAKDIAGGLKSAFSKDGDAMDLVKAAISIVTKLIGAAAGGGVGGIIGGGAGDVIGTLLDAFHSGGVLGPGGRRIVTAHAGRYLRGGTGEAAGLYRGLAGESVFSIAATNNMGGSDGAMRMNRALSLGQPAEGALSIGKLVLQLPGSSAAIDERRMRKKLPGWIRDGVIMARGSAMRRQRKIMGDFTRGGT